MILIVAKEWRDRVIGHENVNKMDSKQFVSSFKSIYKVFWHDQLTIQGNTKHTQDITLSSF